MLKRFNMLLLIVLLVFQTMITPVAVTAEGLGEETDNNAVTTEDVGSSDEGDTSEEAESTENDETDVDEEESNESDVSEGDSESDEDTDINGEETEEEPKTTDVEKPISDAKTGKYAKDAGVNRQSALSSGVGLFAALEENLITEFELSYTTKDGTPVSIEDGSEIEVDLSDLNAVNLKYSL